MNPAPDVCPECATEWPRDTLSCPGCSRLVHKARLKELSATAESLIATKPGEAAKLYRTALELLPDSSKQHAYVERKLAELPVDEGERDSKTLIAKILAGAATLGLLLWKVKPLMLFLGTKGKLLLVGLTKWKTLLSMLVTVGAYSTVFGWPFALGFVVAIYIHEMGHVMALRAYGIPASAPMFIPGVGAYVRMKALPKNAVQDARIGLAGPWAGLAAALLCLLVYFVTDSALMAALTRTGAWINIFNLIPIWQLDGGRAFRSLTKRQRWIATAAAAIAWYLTGDTMLVLVALGGGFRAVFTKPSPEPDTRGLFAFLFLLAALSSLLSVEVALE